MRKEVKVAMVLVLIGIVVSAIYFFSSSEKTIEVKPPQPLTPPIASPSGSESPVAVAPPSVTPEQKTPVSVEPSKPEVKKEGTKPIWTINLEPLNGAPTSKPAVRPTVASHGKKLAEIENAANKVIANQPISLNTLGPAEGTAKSGEKAQGQEELTAEESGQTTHVVKDGETLYQIAKKYYGDGTKWEEIVKANHNLKPERVHVGDKLIIPSPKKKVTVKKDAAVQEPTAQEGVAKVDTVKKVVTSDKASNAQPKASGRTYKVRYGDTLQLIAQEQLGSSARWKDILKVNKDKLKNDPKNLRSDSVIRLPEK